MYACRNKQKKGHWNFFLSCLQPLLVHETTNLSSLSHRCFWSHRCDSFLSPAPNSDDPSLFVSSGRRHPLKHMWMWIEPLPRQRECLWPLRRDLGRHMGESRSTFMGEHTYILLESQSFSLAQARALDRSARELSPPLILNIWFRL
jgi:hypothetical protein